MNAFTSWIDCSPNEVYLRMVFKAAIASLWLTVDIHSSCFCSSSIWLSSGSGPLFYSTCFSSKARRFLSANAKSVNERDEGKRWLATSGKMVTSSSDSQATWIWTSEWTPGKAWRKQFAIVFTPTDCQAETRRWIACSKLISLSGSSLFFVYHLGPIQV